MTLELIHPAVVAVTTWTDIVAAGAAGLGALAALGTLLVAAGALAVAVFAAIYARRQVTAVRAQIHQVTELDWQRSRAYVVAYMETNPTVDYIADLVIENFGATPARNIELLSDSPLVRCPRGSDPDSTRVTPARPIPFLAPGQQWRTSWEQAQNYITPGLALRYTVAVIFTDDHDERRTSSAVLDWTSFTDRRAMSQDPYRTVVTPLKAIAGSLAELTRLAWGGEKPKVTYGGDVLDEHGQAVSAEEADARCGRARARGSAVLAAVRRRLRGGAR